ncbi:MAG: hypothetical protein LC790_04430, partial [Actinobacteria bacterium]|nr:hypothetical protein [Actinomycetota bacterium]
QLDQLHRQGEGHRDQLRLVPGHPARAVPRSRDTRRGGGPTYQACSPPQCGQCTEAVTEASKAQPQEQT